MSSFEVFVDPTGWGLWDVFTYLEQNVDMDILFLPQERDGSRCEILRWFLGKHAHSCMSGGKKNP